jgi:hypothetical protein
VRYRTEQLAVKRQQLHMGKIGGNKTLCRTGGIHLGTGNPIDHVLDREHLMPNFLRIARIIAIEIETVSACIGIVAAVGAVCGYRMIVLIGGWASHAGPAYRFYIEYLRRQCDADNRFANIHHGLRNYRVTDVCFRGTLKLGRDTAPDGKDNIDVANTAATDLIFCKRVAQNNRIICA